MIDSGHNNQPKQPHDKPTPGIARLPADATQPSKPPKRRDDKDDDLPSAGPHAEPDLTNPDATPGAGTLTPPGEHDDIDSTSG